MRELPQLQPSEPGPVSRSVDRAEAPPIPVEHDDVERSSASASPSFPVVGIGASAGGVAAFEAFFKGMPAVTAPGLAFVLVQHLAPDHTSILTEIIRRFTRLEVMEVTDGVVVRPNHVYVIPPGRDMAILNGSLQLLEPLGPHGRRMAIDFFFRSLAQDQRSRAIGIVLSGTGADGTEGIRAIKGEGGLVIAQSPDSADFDGMPASAIATGLVDFELLPGAMIPKVLAYVGHSFENESQRYEQIPARSNNALKRILVLLRAQTGHDFSQYKPSTVLRRIERRMAVHQIAAIEAYARYVQQSPTEVESLFRDLLIGVTSFFRDAECFQGLGAQVIRTLTAGKAPDDTIRVWVAGCSSGEEAYSIAMLLQEAQEAMGSGFRVLIFATDIDPRAIATARAGRFGAGIAADVSADRLARHFDTEPESGGFRVKKSLRDMLIFSEQDLIRDPPFSRLDLLACRNLLIYLGQELQKRLIPLFHYALNPGGFLFLGSSETVGDFNDLFATVDRKHKLYQRREDRRAQRQSIILPHVPTLQAQASPSIQPMLKPAPTAKPTYRELTEQALLGHLSPTGVLVNAQGDILYIHGHTGPYLEPAQGEVSMPNVLKMARDGLRQRLSTALYKAVASQELARSNRVRVKTDGRSILVDLSVSPLPSSGAPGTGAYLIVLVDSPKREASAGLPTPAAQVALGDTPAGSVDSAFSERIAQLEAELRAKDEHLQAATAAMDVSNQDLKSSNEEMQSVNEELQSTNEELETSKEELQSINEELSTVNTELHAKVVDLSRANNDITNLLAGTGIATVFVDMKLCVLRFTPSATELINLIKTDIGRPIAHVVTNLVGYNALVEDAQAVLDTLVPRELEVQTAEGHWYTLRIQPYRTLDNVIEGGVVTFVDITQKKLAEVALKKASEMLRLAVVVRDSSDAISVQDLEGRILAWNPAAVRLYGWSEAEALQMNYRQRIPASLQGAAMAEVLELVHTMKTLPHQTERLTKEGVALPVWVTASTLVDESGTVYAIATTERLHLPGTPSAEPGGT